MSITALQTEFRLLVWPRSHLLLEELVVDHGFYKQGSFRSNSTASLDAYLANMYGEQQPIMLTIQPGQTVIFDGYLLHAGAPGIVDEDGNVIPCPRLHRYMMPIDETINLRGTGGEASVYPITNMHPQMHTTAFAQRFFNLSQLA